MKKARSAFYAVFIGIISFTAIAAQQNQPPPDPLAGSLFPPELIMQNQQALEMTEDQKEYIKAELRKIQTVLTDLQWNLQGEVEKLTAFVSQDQVDETQTLNQLDKVLAQEREIKRVHIGLLVRIKNILTPVQLTRLRRIIDQTK